MKATVDSETCIGCGLCESICPEVFKIGADMIAAVIVETVPEGIKATAQEAADSCPVEAITLEE